MPGEIISELSDCGTGCVFFCLFVFFSVSLVLHQEIA